MHLATTAKPALATPTSTAGSPAKLAASGASNSRRWSEVPPVSGVDASDAAAAAAGAVSVKCSGKRSVAKETETAASGSTGVRTLKVRTEARRHRPTCGGPHWKLLLLTGLALISLPSLSDGLRLLHGPQNMTEFAGRRGMLQCLFDEPVNVTWLRNGYRISYGWRIQLLANSSLQFWPLTTLDTATYKCFAQSGQDEVSSSAILKVVPTPPFLELVPREPVFTSLWCQDPSAVVVKFSYKDRIPLAKYAPVLDFTVEYAANGSAPAWHRSPRYLVPPEAQPTAANGHESAPLTAERLRPLHASPTTLRSEMAPPTRRNFTIVLNLWPSSNYTLQIFGRNRINDGYRSKTRKCSTPARPPPMATPPKLKVFPVLLPYGPA